MAKFIERLFQNDNATPLPWVIVMTAFSILIFNAMTMTMPFAFLPKLVKSFGYSEVETGYYAGLIATSLFVGRTVFSLAWGLLADSKGNKKTLILSAIGLMCSTLLFGFSYNVPWAGITRLLQGSFMGVVITTKSIVVDVCDDTNVTLGLTIIVSSFSTGLILGPSLGGFLSFPTEQYPKTFSQNSIFGKYVVLLPNMFCVVGFMIGIVSVFVFIPKDRRMQKSGEETYLIHSNGSEAIAYGSSSGKEKEKHFVNSSESYCNFSIEKSIEDDRRKKELVDDYHVKYFQLVEPIPKISVSKGCCKAFSKEQFMKSSFVRILRSKDCVAASILYGVFSLAVVGYDELFPLYAATSKEYGGLAFDPFYIGLILLVVSLILLVLQMFIVSRLTARFGAIKVLVLSSVIIAIFVPLTPVTTFIQKKYLLWTFGIINLGLIRFPMAIGFICVNILLNNSVTSDLRSSANGLGMTASSLGRAISPVTLGSIYSWSLTQKKGVESNKNPIGFPFNEFFSFFLISFVMIFTAIFSWKLPRSLDKKKEEEDENKVSVEKHITNMSVSHFRILK